MAFTHERKQELFDNAAKGVIGQRKAAIFEQSCVYRAGDARCALGWSIPDDVYNEDLEGSIPEWGSFIDEPNNIARLVGAETKEDVEFIREMQRCHDMAYDLLGHKGMKGAVFIAMFIGGMLSLSRRYDLDTYSLHDAFNKFNEMEDA